MSNEEIDRAAETPMQSIQDVVKIKQNEAKQYLEKKELEAKSIIDAIVKRQQEKTGNKANGSP